MTGADRTLSSTSWLSRVYGLGSVFAKTVRDSRRATILTGAVLALIFIGVTKAIVSEFDTPQSRLELENISRAVPPILQGLGGKLVNIGTMGGYLQYKYGTFFPLVVSMWSILALSGTLAGEAARGSLDFVVSTPRSRRRVALEKLAGHLAMLGLAMFVAFVSVAYAGYAYPVLPGDEIGVGAAFAYAAWLGLMVLAAGALAFALAPFIGRGAAAGIAGFVTIAGFLLNGYQEPVPELKPFANLTWWGWTQNHLPLAGQSDWLPVVVLGLVGVALLVIGIEAFARRDIGVTSALPMPSVPRFLLGLGGPTRRVIGAGLGSAIAWGAGLGLFGLIMGGASRGFLEQLAESPQFMEILQRFAPGIDYASAGGFMQLVFVQFGVILAGLAAATFVNVWASDETSGRVEMTLATPLSRARWALAGGVGMLVNVGVFVGLAAAGIGLGISSGGGEIATPLLGSLILGVYAAALVGIGVAVGGVYRAGWAAPAVILVVVLTWLIQLLGLLLGLPEFVQQLALTAHYGQPMVGVWDLGGLAASAVLAIGGIALGTWGLRRRDLRA